MRVRPARDEDAAAFAEVVAAVAAEGRWILTEAPVDVAAFAVRVRATLAAIDDALWVVEDGGRVIGGAGLHATRARGVASLGMSILAEHRGRGAGRALLAAVLAHARAAGLHKVELEVFPDNGRAIALYANHGFAVEGLRRDHYLRRDGRRRSALLMARLLDAEHPD